MDSQQRSEEASQQHIDLRPDQVKGDPDDPRLSEGYSLNLARVAALSLPPNPNNMDVNPAPAASAGDTSVTTTGDASVGTAGDASVSTPATTHPWSSGEPEMLWAYMKAMVDELKIENIPKAKEKGFIKGLFEAMGEPQVRDINWNQHFKGEKFSEKYGQNIFALVVYLTGKMADGKCCRCENQGGPFEGCILPPDRVWRNTTLRACANCIYNWRKNDCLHNPSSSKKRKRGPISQGDGEPLDGDFGPGRDTTREATGSRPDPAPVEDNHQSASESRVPIVNSSLSPSPIRVPDNWRTQSGAIWATRKFSLTDMNFY